MTDFGKNRIGDGKLGGKGEGLVRLHKLVSELDRVEENRSFTRNITIPKTIFVTTSAFTQFIKFNGLEAAVENAEKNELADYEKLREGCKAGKFPPELQSKLFQILEEIRNPIAVRSSSLLEDQKGAAFAGKYESVLIGNQGSVEERQTALLNAVREVYASTFNPSALSYRRKHGFANDREEMALVVQEVVGQKYDRYYLPAMAGVAFSRNGYCWADEIKPHDGLVRLVFGLGAGAVARGYVRLFSPAKPSLRPEGTDVNNVQKCSQKKVYVIDLETNEMKSVHFRELVTDGFNCYPGAQAMVSLRDSNYLYRPVSNLWDPSHVPMLTMDGVLEREWMKMNVPALLSWLLKELEKGFGYAVDVEFAITHDPDQHQARFHLLQTRPLSQSLEKGMEIPSNLKDEDVIFRVSRNLPTSHVPDIEYLVYVDDLAYREWPFREKPTVARAVGKINEALKGKRFALIGPGRWGSWNAQLGVPANYSEICHCVMLAEVARRQESYVPEVSFGSHFFQDLIEDKIAYLPVYPDEPGQKFNEKILKSENHLKKVLPDAFFRQFDSLIKVIHVPSAAGGRKAHAVLDGEAGKAALFLR